MNELQKLLKQLFNEKKEKNKSFSLRAFSKKIGLSSSALSEFLNGKRRFSEGLVLSVLERLEALNDNDLRVKRLLEKTKRLINDPLKTRSSSTYQILQDEVFQILSGWENYAILSLIETIDFKSDIAWISKRLGLSEGQVTQAVDRLTQLNLIKKTKFGDWVGTGENLTSSESIRTDAGKQLHKEGFELAHKALMELTDTVRDIYSITFCTDPKGLPVLRKKIRQFGRSLATQSEKKKKSQVYRLCVQLFPLTKS